MKSKTIIFIDGSNTYFAQKKSGFWLDWAKVKAFFEEQYEVLEYRYYVGLRKNDKSMEKFLRKLKKIGFRVITKLVKSLLDEQGHYIEKANFDVEITGDVMKNLSRMNVVVLFSGDSDFVYLIHTAHEQGKKLYIVSSRRTIAWELKLQADRYFLLEHLKKLTRLK